MSLLKISLFLISLFTLSVTNVNASSQNDTIPIPIKKPDPDPIPNPGPSPKSLISSNDDVIIKYNPSISELAIIFFIDMSNARIRVNYNDISLYDEAINIASGDHISLNIPNTSNGLLEVFVIPNSKDVYFCDFMVE